VRNQSDLGLDVSRETFGRLEHYVELLNKWNPKINLVSPNTLREAWTRHFVDSAQIYRLASEKTKIWADFGSGGGFPGMVVAILAAELNPDLQVTLVESDVRKCAFLRSVARETGVQVTVSNQRIETLEPLNADVISARALASLPLLFEFSTRHVKNGGKLLFPKGMKWKTEVEEAVKSWTFSLETHTSVTDPNAVILEIGELVHV
jgi:16S rRNA (guanine527-N7)-methyltransferase